MNFLLLLFDVRPDPTGPVPWGALVVLLAIIMVITVTLLAGLVLLLIRWKGRNPAHSSNFVRSDPSSSHGID